MKIYLLLFLTLISGSFLVAETKSFEMEWFFNPETELYTNGETKIPVPKNLAGFRRTRATPVRYDGSASFAFTGDSGVITLYLSHKDLHGFEERAFDPGGFRNQFLEAVEIRHGELKNIEFFDINGLIFEEERSGIGFTAFVKKSSTFNSPVHTCFAVISIDGFLLYFRGTSPKKSGISDFFSFIGKYNLSMAPNKTSQVTATRRPLARMLLSTGPASELESHVTCS